MHQSVLPIVIRLMDVDIGSLLEEDFDAIVEAVAFVVDAEQHERSHSSVRSAVDIHHLFVIHQLGETGQIIAFQCLKATQLQQLVFLLFVSIASSIEEMLASNPII